MTAFLDCLEINEILKQRGNIFETYETHNNQVITVCLLSFEDGL